jgi:hypothetical protein
MSFVPTPSNTTLVYSHFSGVRSCSEYRIPALHFRTPETGRGQGHVSQVAKFFGDEEKLGMKRRKPGRLEEFI